MYCSKCGVQNSEGSTHCVNCGNDLLMQMSGAAPAQRIEAKTSGLAIASFVMGLLCLTCFLWPVLVLPAIICGIVALVKISNHRPYLKGTGMAITGIVIPAVMFVIVPMVLAILMPALSKTKHMAQRVVCGTNLKGLATAMTVYANDYDDTLPPEDWCDLLILEADVSPKSFVCPDSDVIEGECSYAMNKNLIGKHMGKCEPNTVLFFETDLGLESGPRNSSIQGRRHYEFMNEFSSYYDENLLVYERRFNQLGGSDDLLLRHDSNNQIGCNIVFVDGHTEFVTQDRIAELQWAAE